MANTKFAFVGIVLRFARRPFDRLVAWLWGYDFFISYHWASGGAYAVALAEALRRKKYEIFLDRVEFSLGENYRVSAKRALDRSRAMILIATDDALLTSQPVREEVEYFASRSCDAIIPIYFSRQPRGILPVSGVLKYIDPATLHFEEERIRLRGSPSDNIVERLHQRTRGIRKRLVRQWTVVVVTVALLIAAALTWKKQYDARIAESERALALSKGTVKDESGFHHVTFEGAITLEAVECVNRMCADRPVICFLQLGTTTAEDIRAVATIDRLETLVIAGKDGTNATVAPAALIHLTAAKGLQRLLLKDQLFEAPMARLECIRDIARLTSLRVFACIHCNLTSQDLEPLSGSPLRVLAVSNNGFDSRCWKTLATMSSLQEVHLDDMPRPLVDAGNSFRAFAEASRIQLMSIGQTGTLSDEQAEAIGRMKCLRLLNIRKTSLSETALQQLLQIPSLETINVEGTGVSCARIQELSTRKSSLLTVLVGQEQMKNRPLGSLQAGLKFELSAGSPELFISMASLYTK